MAGDPLDRLREVLGVGPGVILSEDEIAKALASMAGPEANAIRAQLAPAEPRPVKRYVFGGVRR
jgi:hypothetical protein